MNEIREYITALLLGDDLTLDLKSYENYSKNFESHSTALTPRSYLEEQRFHVEVQRMMPVYLRGWIANEFKQGSWYLNPELDSFEEYRKKFGVQNDTHENLLDLFYKHMNPNTSSEIDNYLIQYSTQTRFGYVTMQVNISTRFGVIPPMLKIPANKVHCNTYKSIIDIKHIIKRLKIPHLYF